MEETVEALNQERQLIEATMEELLRINQADFNLDVIKGLDTEPEDMLKQRMQYSMIELIKEKNASLAALLSPSGMSDFFKEQSEIIASGPKPKKLFAMSAEKPKVLDSSAGFLRAADEIQ